MSCATEAACGTNDRSGYDVIVVGGGASGAIAAIASAPLGAKTLLVEKQNCAGGVATSGLEMSQNSQRMSWSREDVDEKLHNIMIAICDDVNYQKLWEIRHGRLLA